MKALLLTTVFLCLFMSLNAQVTIKDGRVGIGTSFPSELLHIGGGNIMLDNGNTTLGLTRSLTIGGARNLAGNSFAEINFQNLDDNSGNIEYTGARISSENSDGIDDGDLRFATNNGTLTTHMILEADGNVGIGALAPSENLVVGDDIGGYAGARITIGNTTGFSGMNIGNDSANRAFMIWDNLNHYLKIGSKALDVIYDNTIVVRNGAVGINTSTPFYDLQVGDANLAATNGSDTRMAVTNNVNGNRAAILGLARTNGGSKVEAQFEANGSNASGPSVIIGSATSHPLYVRTGNTTQMTVTTTGTVGINTITPSWKLEVNGSAAKPGGGSWTVSSDARLKQDISDYNSGLSDVLAIRPVRYRYNSLSGYNTEEEYVGVIAQELEKVAPYMIDTFQKDGKEYLAVDASAMTYMLLNAVQELAGENAEMKAELDELRSLRADLDKLTARLNEQIASRE